MGCEAGSCGCMGKHRLDHMQWAVCRRMPSTQIVAMGVLPKGQTWPNTCTEAITNANKRLQEYAEKHKPWLHYIDLGNRFLTHQVRVGPKPGHKIPYHTSKRSSAAQTSSNV